MSTAQARQQRPSSTSHGSTVTAVHAVLPALLLLLLLLLLLSRWAPDELKLSKAAVNMSETAASTAVAVS
jgi:hypothetical protein